MTGAAILPTTDELCRELGYLGGATVALIAKLVDEAGNPLQGKELIFEKSTDGVNYVEFARRITNEEGEAYAGDSPTTTTYYRVRFEGDESYGPSSAEAVYTP